MVASGADRFASHPTPFGPRIAHRTESAGQDLLRCSRGVGDRRRSRRRAGRRGVVSRETSGMNSRFLEPAMPCCRQHSPAAKQARMIASLPAAWRTRSHEAGSRAVEDEDRMRLRHRRGTRHHDEVLGGGDLVRPGRRQRRGWRARQHRVGEVGVGLEAGHSRRKADLRPFQSSARSAASAATPRARCAPFDPANAVPRRQRKPRTPAGSRRARRATPLRIAG